MSADREQGSQANRMGAPKPVNRATRGGIQAWHGAVCYHPRRHAWPEIIGTRSWSHLKCLDCGAQVSAAYGSVLPELVPQPTERGRALGLEADLQIGETDGS